MVRAMANLNESLRLSRFVMMLDEPNLFLVYLSLALKFWYQDGKENATTKNEVTDHLTTNLRLVDILMTRLKLLSRAMATVRVSSQGRVEFANLGGGLGGGQPTPVFDCHPHQLPPVSA